MDASVEVTETYAGDLKKYLLYFYSHPGEIYMDDTDGLFVFGGTETTTSFKGYIGQATFYRGHAIEPTKVSILSWE